MSYKLGWHTPGKVLSLALSGDYTLKEAKEVNGLILQELNSTTSPLHILIDATDMNRPFNFTSIRDVQTFMHHPQIHSIYAITGDRLIKLAMMVIFNLSKSSLQIFDEWDKADHTLQRQLMNS